MNYRIAIGVLLSLMLFATCGRRDLGTFVAVSFKDSHITLCGDRIVALEEYHKYNVKSPGLPLGENKRLTVQMRYRLFVFDTSGTVLLDTLLCEDTTWISCEIKAVTDSSALVVVADSIGIFSLRDGQFKVVGELCTSRYPSFSGKDYVFLSESQILYEDGYGYPSAVKLFDLQSRTTRIVYSIEGDFHLSSGAHISNRTAFLYRAALGEYAIALLNVDDGLTTTFVSVGDITNAYAFGDSGLAVYRTGYGQTSQIDMGQLEGDMFRVAKLCTLSTTPYQIHMDAAGSKAVYEPIDYTALSQIYLHDLATNTIRTVATTQSP